MTPATTTTRLERREYHGFEVEGVRYSHLLDPRTGLGLTDPDAGAVG